MRETVGARYRDIIESADSIAEMQRHCGSIMDSVASMDGSCSGLQEAVLRDAAIGPAGAAGEQSALGRLVSVGRTCLRLTWMLPSNWRLITE